MRQVKLFWTVLATLGLCISLAVLPAFADDDDDDRDEVNPRILIASEGENGIITIIGIGLHDGEHVPEVTLGGTPLSNVTILDPEDGMMLTASLPPNTAQGSYELLVFPEGRDDDDDDDDHHGREHDDDDVARFVLTIEEGSGSGGSTVTTEYRDSGNQSVNEGNCKTSKAFCTSLQVVGGGVGFSVGDTNPLLKHGRIVRSDFGGIGGNFPFWEGTVCLDDDGDSLAESLQFKVFATCLKVE